MGDSPKDSNAALIEPKDRHVVVSPMVVGLNVLTRKLPLYLEKDHSNHHRHNIMLVSLLKPPPQICGSRPLSKKGLELFRLMSTGSAVRR